MNIQLQKLSPSRAEFVLFGLISVFVSIIGNGKQLLQHYNLSSSAHLIGGVANNGIADGLAQLDKYKATTTIVSFAVWGVIGLLTLSIVQAIIHLSKDVSYKSQVGSNAYVHPVGFSKQDFWKKLLLQTTTSFIVFLFAGAYIALLALCAVPVALLYTRVFYTQISAANISYFLIGLAVLFVAAMLLDITIRMIIFRNRLIQD